MADTKLSSLALGTTPAFQYGLDIAGLSKRFNTSAVLNVKDFGADPSGGNDSYAAIQACFNLAFGPPGAPHGQGGVNRPVYFPVGGYKILTPLIITALWGGKIFGDGMLQSGISYQGPLTSAVNAEGWVPVIWLNGANFCEIANMGFSGPADPTNHKTVCLWFGPDGISSSSAHGNLLTNLISGGTSYAYLHGSAASAANSENTYLNCSILGPHEYGLYCSGSNTLNMRWIGGAVDSCSVAGFKTNNAATIPIIQSCAFANNILDIDFVASGRSVISGCRTESANFIRCNTALDVIECWSSCPGGTLTGGVVGTTLTVQANGSKGAICFPGEMVAGTDGTNSLPHKYNSQTAGTQGITRIVRQLTGNQFGVGTYQLSNSPTPGNIAPGSTLSVFPSFAELMGASSLSLSGCGSDNDQAIIGDGNSNLFIRNNQWYSANDGAMAPHLVSAYSGQILEYDVAGFGQYLVSTLPKPTPSFKGVRMFVTDSSVTTFGTPVAPGGTNAVPVWCDGFVWKVG